jgi:hypothetical protein
MTTALLPCPKRPLHPVSDGDYLRVRMDTTVNCLENTHNSPLPAPNQERNPHVTNLGSMQCILIESYDNHLSVCLSVYLHNSVEEAQSKEQLLEVARPGRAAIVESFVTDGVARVALQQICTQSLWGQPANRAQ